MYLAINDSRSGLSTCSQSLLHGGITWGNFFKILMSEFPTPEIIIEPSDIHAGIGNFNVQARLRIANLMVEAGMKQVFESAMSVLKEKGCYENL